MVTHGCCMDCLVWCLKKPDGCSAWFVHDMNVLLRPHRYASGVGATRAAAEVKETTDEWENQQLFLSPQFLGLIRSEGDHTVNGAVIPISSQEQLVRQVSGGNAIQAAGCIGKRQCMIAAPERH